MFPYAHSVRLFSCFCWFIAVVPTVLLVNCVVTEVVRYSYVKFDGCAVQLFRTGHFSTIQTSQSLHDTMSMHLTCTYLVRLSACLVSQICCHLYKDSKSVWCCTKLSLL